MAADTTSTPGVPPRGRREARLGLPTGRVVSMTTTNLRTDLQPVVARLLERHLETTREWFPHELVPWSKGRDFVPGEEWDAAQSPVPAAARVALVVNLL